MSEMLERGVWIVFRASFEEKNCISDSGKPPDGTEHNE